MAPAPNLMTVIDRLDQAERARPRDPAALVAALEDALALSRADVARDELPGVSELASELADEYENLGRYDDAIAAMQEAIDAGWAGVPDGRCRIAEILAAAGRTREADDLWDVLVAEFPDDVWVFNNAGFEYARREPAIALRHFSRALELALDSGDPERLVRQLADGRSAALQALGMTPVDELQRRAEYFLVGPLPPASEGRPAAVGGVVALAWFPVDQLPAALRHWPDLLVSSGATDHAGYCAALERHLHELAAAEPGPAIQLHIAPVDVEDYLAWTAGQGEDPGEAPSRAHYAAELARTGQTIAWPPRRNSPCWCGAGRKYKHCCLAGART